MKLYTEEQMAKVWMAGQKYWETSGASITFEDLLEHEKPIELPSDEEIEEQSFDKSKTEDASIRFMCEYYFIKGAKWMKEQRLNQNK